MKINAIHDTSYTSMNNAEKFIKKVCVLQSMHFVVISLKLKYFNLFTATAPVVSSLKMG